MKYDCVLWDWNGTLLDDLQLTVDCVNEILSTYGLEPTNLRKYLEMFEFPLPRYYAKLFDLNEHPFDEVTEIFQNYYTNNFFRARLNPQSVCALENFKKCGVKQFIVSSFVEEKLVEYAKHFEIFDYFEKISGAGDILAGRKSNRAVDIIRSCNSKRALIIGDTAHDYETAADCGCDCVLVSCGHQKYERLKALQPASDLKVVQTLSEAVMLANQ